MKRIAFVRIFYLPKNNKIQTLSEIFAFANQKEIWCINQKSQINVEVRKVIGK